MTDLERELLEALKGLEQFSDWIDTRYDPDDIKLVKAAVDKALAAIAKAEGKA